MSELDLEHSLHGAVRRMYHWFDATYRGDRKLPIEFTSGAGMVYVHHKVKYLGDGRAVIMLRATEEAEL